MHIELVSKAIYWYGDNGVVMLIYTRASNSDSERLYDLGVKISGLGEVSLSYMGHPIYDERRGMVEQWLETTGLLSEWRGETAKYISTLSRIDLPSIPHYVLGRSGYLSYSLKLEGKGLGIELEIDVDNEKAVMDIELVGKHKIELGKVTITGAVTTDSVKVAVSRLLDSMWGLLDLPLEAN